MKQQHQSIKNGICKDEIKKVTYLVHGFSPAFLDLFSQVLWDWIVEVAVIERMTTTNPFDSQPATTNKAKTLNCLVSIM